MSMPAEHMQPKFNALRLYYRVTWMRRTFLCTEFPAIVAAWQRATCFSLARALVITASTSSMTRSKLASLRSPTMRAPQSCRIVILRYPMLAIENLAKHLGNIANRFFDAPSASVRVIGVTGTNGKTTVAWLIAQCLERLGEPCAYIGTLGSGIGELILVRV